MIPGVEVVAVGVIVDVVGVVLVIVFVGEGVILEVVEVLVAVLVSVVVDVVEELALVEVVDDEGVDVKGVGDDVADVEVEEVIVIVEI